MRDILIYIGITLMMIFAFAHSAPSVVVNLSDRVNTRRDVVPNVPTPSFGTPDQATHRMHLSYLADADANATTHPINGLYGKDYQEKFDAEFKARLKVGDTHDDAATAAHEYALEQAGVQAFDMTAEEKKSNTIANILYQARAAGFTDSTLLANLVSGLEQNLDIATIDTVAASNKFYGGARPDLLSPPATRGCLVLPACSKPAPTRKSAAASVEKAAPVTPIHKSANRHGLRAPSMYPRHWNT